MPEDEEDLVKKAEEIASRAWGEKGKFKCPFQEEISNMVKRLALIGDLCLSCSEDNDIQPELRREIKCVLTVWRTIMEYRYVK